MRLNRHAILSTSEQWLPVGQEMAATRGEVQISARHANIDGPGFGALLAASVNIRRPSINRERRVARSSTRPQIVGRRDRVFGRPGSLEYEADSAFVQSSSGFSPFAPHSQRSGVLVTGEGREAR